jgi:hypothetical protein
MNPIVMNPNNTIVPMTPPPSITQATERLERLHLLGNNAPVRSGPIHRKHKNKKFGLKRSTFTIEPINEEDEDSDYYDNLRVMEDTPENHVFDSDLEKAINRSLMDQTSEGRSLLNAMSQSTQVSSSSLSSSSSSSAYSASFPRTNLLEAFNATMVGTNPVPKPEYEPLFQRMDRMENRLAVLSAIVKHQSGEIKELTRECKRLSESGCIMTEMYESLEARHRALSNKVFDNIRDLRGKDEVSDAVTDELQRRFPK